MGISISPMGMQQAAAALRSIERRQEVVANNLANVSTNGFKAERTFARLLADGSLPVLDAATDRRQGAFQRTDAPLDVAIEGDGFFVVEVGGTEQLTRGGSWRLDADGFLVDTRGARVLGEDDLQGGQRGPIQLPLETREIRIDRDGTVLADGVQKGRLRLEHVPADVPLGHAGDGRFHAPVGRVAIAATERRILQGAVEESNVGTVESMVDLIDIQRAFTTVQKAVHTIDAARAIIVSDIAKPI